MIDKKLKIQQKPRGQYAWQCVYGSSVDGSHSSVRLHSDFSVLEPSLLEFSRRTVTTQQYRRVKEPSRAAAMMMTRRDGEK
jgi:hypothetical protein